jgi:hypothetical protein
MRRPIEEDRGRRVVGGAGAESRLPFAHFWTAHYFACQLLHEGHDPQLLRDYERTAREEGWSVFSDIVCHLLSPDRRRPLWPEAPKRRKGRRRRRARLTYELYMHEGQPSRWNVLEGEAGEILGGYGWVCRTDGRVLEHGVMHAGPGGEWGYRMRRSKPNLPPTIVALLMTVVRVPPRRKKQ